MITRDNAVVSHEANFFTLLLEMLRLNGYTVVTLTTVTLASLIGAYFYQKKKKVVQPVIWEPVGKVTKLCLYPLKSGHRLELTKADCTKVGLRQTKDDEKVYQLRDRELIVYSAVDHEFRTARTYPKMVLVEVSVHDEKHFAIEAPNMRTLYVKRPLPAKSKDVEVICWYSEKIKAIDCGDEAAVWFSRYLLNQDTGLRLGYHDGVFQRNVMKPHEKFLYFYKNLTNDCAGLFSDLSTCLIVNQTSVDDLNKLMKKSQVTVEHFRPNIAISSLPYAEDEWDWIKIGKVILRVAKPCTRCVMTTINPETAERDPHNEPLKTLKTYRLPKHPELQKLEKNAPIMGINCGVIKTGRINIGDPVYVGKL